MNRLKGPKQPSIMTFVSFISKTKRAREKRKLKTKLSRLQVINQESELIVMQGIRPNAISEIPNEKLIFTGLNPMTGKTVGVHACTTSKRVTAEEVFNFPKCDKIIYYKTIRLFFCQDRNIYVFQNETPVRFYFIKAQYMPRGFRSTHPRDFHLEGRFLYFTCMLTRPFAKDISGLIRLDLEDLYRLVPKALHEEVWFNMEKYMVAGITQYLKCLVTGRGIYLLWRSGLNERYSKQTLQLTKKREPTSKMTLTCRFSNAKMISFGFNFLVAGFCLSGASLVLQLVSPSFFEKSVAAFPLAEPDEKAEIFHIAACSYRFHDILAIVLPRDHIYFFARYKCRFLQLKTYFLMSASPWAELLHFEEEPEEQAMVFYSLEPAFHRLTFRI